MNITRIRKHGWLALLVGTFLVGSTVSAAVSTPVVTTYPEFTNTSPVAVSGTADASTTVTISGGASTSTATVDGSGNWNAMVDLVPNLLNNLTITADDGMGSTSSSTMIEITYDNTDPVFGTTTDVTATATSSSGTSVTFTTPSATDNLSASTTVMCTPASGTNFDVGTTTVTCTAEDDAGNTATTTFDVIVDLDSGTSTPPVDNDITITHPIFVSGLFCAATTPVLLEGTTEANSNITVTGALETATTTSNGSGNWSTMLNLASNATTTVLVSVTDSGSNEIASTTLNFVFDTTAPVITLNGNSEVDVATGGTFNDPGVTVTDNLDANVTATTTGGADLDTEGTYTILYTATDCAGNTATTTRTINVDDDLNSGGGSSGGGSSSGRNGISGLVNAGSVANPNSAVAFVLAGFVIDGNAGTPGIPNTGFSLGQFIRDLILGSRGDDVAQLQTRLGLAGLFNGPITGYFGPLTRAAVIRLQQGLGLPATGALDASTRAVLNGS